MLPPGVDHSLPLGASKRSSALAPPANTVADRTAPASSNALRDLVIIYFPFVTQDVHRQRYIKRSGMLILQQDKRMR
jgi:hypothetical protein